MPTIHFDGCRTEPLGSYLKALGVLRLVGEQLDPDAAGWWAGDRFCLDTSVSPDELTEFFLARYEPTPIVTPWNGGSGFGMKDPRTSPAAVQNLAYVEESSCSRLAPYREAISAARRLVEGNDWHWAAAAKNAKEAKARLVSLCRAWLPDSSVAWIDAAVVLTDDGPQYPPLLGTGGNLGRLELSKNFLARLAEVIPADDNEPHGAEAVKAAGWLRASLHDESSPALVGAPIGQFDPGHAGGANSGPFGDAGPLVNPWDFVLLFEGALLFASGSARRMGGGVSGRSAMPFMVRSTAVGYPTGTAEEGSKGEMWAPLWNRPAGIGEVSRLIAEGRSAWNGSQSRTGLDFVRAAGSLGVDRGIDSFVRHCFVERHGQNMLAVSAGRIDVEQRPGVPVLARIDSWVRRIAWAKNKPGSVEAALREVERAQFAVATERGSRGSAEAPLQRVLVGLSRLESAVALSTELRDEKARSPLTGLSAAEWVPLLDDGSAELHLAVAIASQRDVHRPGAARGSAESNRPACYLRPVRLDQSGRRLEWSRQAPRVTGLGVRPVNAVLADFLIRRTIDAASFPAGAGSETGQIGVQPSFTAAVTATLADTGLLARGAIDRDRFSDLLRACLLLDFRNPGRATWYLLDGPVASTHPAHALLAPFFHGHPLLIDGTDIHLRPDPSWPRLLATGTRSALESVIGDALRRLRIARLDPAPSTAAAMSAGIDPLWLGAALLTPLDRSSVRRLLQQTLGLASGISDSQTPATHIEE